MRRIEVLDGMRGWCLVLMMITHLNFGQPFFLGYLHFKEISFTDSAQAFIFLSGFLVGLLGVRQHARGGAWPVAQRYWRRAGELFGCHLFLLLVILLAVRLVPSTWFAWREWLQHLMVQGEPYVGATALLLYQPTLLDILPQYILYLLAAPALIHLIGTGRAGLVVAGSFAVWLGVQLGMHQPLAAWLDTWQLGGRDFVLRTAFNPLAWQILFVGGLVLGGLFERGELPAEAMFARGNRMLLQLACVLFLLFAAIRIGVNFGLHETPFMERLRYFDDRANLGLIRVLSFASFAYLTVWMATTAITSGRAWLQLAGQAVRRILVHPTLAMIGRNSLPVFVYHVLLIYTLRHLVEMLGGLPDPWFSLLGLLAIASLAVPALAFERPQQRARTKAKPVSG